MKLKNKKRFVTIMITMLIITLSISFCSAKQEIKFSKYTVTAGETFWNIYNENYDNNMSWSEALYNFKTDNGFSAGDLKVGQLVKIRI